MAYGWSVANVKTGIGSRRRNLISVPVGPALTALPRAQKGYENAIGRSRGGRTAKIHALTDDLGAMVITSGNTHDLDGAE